MNDIIKLSAVFLLIVLLLRRKLKIGLVMVLASAALAAVYRMPPRLAADTALRLLYDGITVKLLAALLLIRVLEVVLREKDVLSKMMAASAALLKSRRAVIVSMPLLIGMLPSVGGAYFSAPMVEEATRGMEMQSAEKGFINYWFRHPWEFVLPLYPGLILAAALSGVGLRGLIAANMPYAVAMAVGGFALSMKELGGKGSGRRESVSREGLMSFIPIASVLALVMVFDTGLPLALLIVIIGLFIAFRYGARELGATLKKGFSFEVVVLIGGVMLFKGMMQSSGAVEGLSAYFSSNGLPLMPMLFLLPFVTGLLTGLTIGFVSTTFPLLLSLQGGDTIAAVTFAFAAGFTGVLLSPVHVCLVLTREYFKADITGMFRRLLLPAALVMAVAAAEYLVLI